MDGVRCALEAGHAIFLLAVAQHASVISAIEYPGWIPARAALGRNDGFPWWRESISPIASISTFECLSWSG